MYRLDDNLRTLIESGLRQGHLTFSQVNSFLPNEAADPLQLDNLIVCLEELNIQLVADPVKPEPAPDAETPRSLCPFHDRSADRS